jgi:hypothetical protein
MFIRLSRHPPWTLSLPTWIKGCGVIAEFTPCIPNSTISSFERERLFPDEGRWLGKI